MRVIVSRYLAIDRCVSHARQNVCRKWPSASTLFRQYSSFEEPRLSDEWPGVRIQRKYELCVSTVSQLVIIVNHVGEFDRCAFAIFSDTRTKSFQLGWSRTIGNGKVNCAGAIFDVIRVKQLERFSLFSSKLYWRCAFYLRACLPSLTQMRMW